MSLQSVPHGAVALTAASSCSLSSCVCTRFWKYLVSIGTSDHLPATSVRKLPRSKTTTAHFEYRSTATPQTTTEAPPVRNLSGCKTTPTHPEIRNIATPQTTTEAVTTAISCVATTCCLKQSQYTAYVCRILLLQQCFRRDAAKIRPQQCVQVCIRLLEVELQKLDCLVVQR